MMQPTITSRTRQGTIRNGGIIMDSPLDFPEGTKVVISIHASDSPVATTSQYAPVGRTDVSNEELLRLAEKYPPPKEWWDATDDPFQP